MFTVNYGGKTYTPTDIERVELGMAKRVLELFNQGLTAKEIFTEEALKATDDAMTQEYLASNGAFNNTDVSCTATGISAEEFFAEFKKIMMDQPRMLASNPEHFRQVDQGNGDYSVLEFMGGRPMIGRLKFNDDFLKIVPPTPGYPIRLTGQGYANGYPIAGILHEFKNVENGFEGRLQIFFPAATDEKVVEYHRQHLAVEWYNWYRQAMEVLGRDPN